MPINAEALQVVQKVGGRLLGQLDDPAVFLHLLGPGLFAGLAFRVGHASRGPAQLLCGKRQLFADPLKKFPKSLMWACTWLPMYFRRGSR